MKTTIKTLTITLSLCLLTLSGCGIIDMAQVPHEDVENWRTFAPNDYGIKIVRND